jgi:hypothetical protein
VFFSSAFLLKYGSVHASASVRIFLVCLNFASCNVRYVAAVTEPPPAFRYGGETWGFFSPHLLLQYPVLFIYIFRPLFSWYSEFVCLRLPLVSPLFCPLLFFHILSARFTHLTV